MPQSGGSSESRHRRGGLAVVLAGLLVAAVSMTAPRARAEWTPEQLAGQRVVYSYRGLTPPPSLLDAIRGGRAAGVIFFGENISDPEQIAGVVAQLREAQAQSPIRQPLLLMTDQEGGLVRRLPGEPTLSEKQVGSAPDPVAAAVAAGVGAGNNLRGVGMNVNLAPVLDVFDTPGNFIDGPQRSYSSDPAEAAALGASFIVAQQTTGVAATAKHFPGLGKAPAGQNTDLGPVTLPVSLPTLRAVDELPYPAAVTAGVKLIMVSWATYPALDPDHPAGLSPTIVGQELRGHNGFQGVTITDALEAGSLDAFGTTGQRAVAAAAAGMDLILCSTRDTTQGDDATAALAAAYTDGRLDRAAFSTAVDRITALRAGLS
ncbi:beta-N-acetylhexosaminidase [Nocardia terpenica]|uniref:glycoside hydrolase family 3 N-terminal domain-containing protein n=1 Tax=Nocardia terpenica TaxID=455432 RepID=UPI0018956151|nr:glycoside hydrolase family 3 N-terminal domain-containing protein [Nocardia terpenica]MBF6063356.1 beta-N-acetylhexosaminidase [Nocardia terpenica]MBF6105912.1 beta-N-acetylhexosaminidase [Nocardia terpenica]MBF6113504.1 beta-N-acetylhexosaminidase [Nocardia terpenica]MBF6119653.1 beta-N-acetylhexosaminidase [Nocardia terpenica]MBF6152064.1 beta-N-acetylhexosaminidase [Nocardia terpenica]